MSNGPGAHMGLTRCEIGDLIRTPDGIVTLTITCVGEEITQLQMIEAVEAIDAIAVQPSPLLVDASQPHSVSFDALLEMAKATKVTAVAIYAPGETAQLMAEYIGQFQEQFTQAPYPFEIFADITLARNWLHSISV